MIDSARLVVAIAREGSLTGAAARLDLSVGTVSRRLAALERELGVVLFERTTRTLRTTPTGRELAFAFERGVDEIERALRRVRDQEDTVSGIVRATVPPTLASVFAPMLIAFQAAYPEVRLQLVATEERLSYSMEELDVLIRVGPLEEDELVARPLVSYRHILCATPKVARRIQTLEDLASARAMVWGRRSSDAVWNLERGGESLRFEPQAVLLTNDYALIAQMIESGDAVGELPAPVASVLLEEHTLARVLPAWRLPSVSLSVLYAPRLLPRAVRVFVEHLRGEFAECQRTLDAAVH